MSLLFSTIIALTCGCGASAQSFARTVSSPATDAGWDRRFDYLPHYQFLEHAKVIDLWHEAMAGGVYYLDTPITRVHRMMTADFGKPVTGPREIPIYFDSWHNTKIEVMDASAPWSDVRAPSFLRTPHRGTVLRLWSGMSDSNTLPARTWDHVDLKGGPSTLDELKAGIAPARNPGDDFMRATSGTPPEIYEVGRYCRVSARLTRFSGGRLVYECLFTNSGPLATAPIYCSGATVLVRSWYGVVTNRVVRPVETTPAAVGQVQPGGACVLRLTFPIEDSVNLHWSVLHMSWFASSGDSDYAESRVAGVYGLLHGAYGNIPPGESLSASGGTAQRPAVRGLVHPLGAVDLRTRPREHSAETRAAIRTTRTQGCGGAIARTCSGCASRHLGTPTLPQDNKLMLDRLRKMSPAESATPVALPTRCRSSCAATTSSV